MKRILQIGIPIAILVLVITAVGSRIHKSLTSVPVQVIEVQPEDRNARIIATGTVKAFREAAITWEVRGLVEYVSPKLVPGGLLDSGEVMARIDDRDYRFAYQKSRENAAQAQLRLNRLTDRVLAARQEWLLFQTKRYFEPDPLVLYEHQLINAGALLDSALEENARALLSLEKTVIRAPFASMVMSLDTARDRFVTPGSQAAQLAGIDKARVFISLALSEMKLVDVPCPSGDIQGSRVKIRNLDDAEDIYRNGTITGSAGEICDKTETVLIIAEVEDPCSIYTRDRGPAIKLSFGSSVLVEIIGKMLEDVIVVPQKALRENSSIWIAGERGRLQIKPVEIKRFEGDYVLISSGLKPGEKIVLTSIPDAIQGMKLRVEN